MAIRSAQWPVAMTVRLLAGCGAAATFACLALLVALQVIEPAANLLHGMISDLVFGPDPWLFDLAVLLLVAGSLAVRLCCLAPTGLAVLPIMLSVPIPFPFGLIQRATGLLAVALLLLFAGWAWQAAVRPAPMPGLRHGPAGDGLDTTTFWQLDNPRSAS